MHFDDFVAGPHNAKALWAARDLIEGVSVGPLLLKGVSGSGKTCLLACVASEAKSRELGSVVSMSAEQFAGKYFTADESGRLRFLEDVASADFLLIDDIDWLSGRDAAQEALSEIIPYVIAKHGRVAVALGHSAIGDLGSLRVVLARFETVTVGLPGRAARQALLHRFCDGELSDQVILALADRTEGVDCWSLRALAAETVARQHLGYTTRSASG